ncbi:MAG TPA: ABC transporter ATP-binding protein [Anaerolineales bacterium]|nr:ABC transporter ATP-binding protein [Anaerolineales bacterium]
MKDSPSTPVLQASHLEKRYSNGPGGLLALRDVSLTVHADEFVCVVGPSGSGKTTLLRLLAGLIRPTAGQVFFEGRPLEGPRRRIGFVFQQANLMPWRTSLDNVRLPLELYGLGEAEQWTRARQLLDLVGLAAFESTYPHNLSGGMAQRVALARALVHQPDLLLLDEPFGSLDALTRERMAAELLRIWNARPVTVVMVTHSIPEAIILADRVIVLSPQPGEVRLELPVPLPRPRSLDLEHTAAFGALAAKIRAAL